MHLDALQETGEVTTDSAAYWHALLHINEGEYERALEVPSPAKPLRAAFDALRALAMAKLNQIEGATDTLHSIAGDYFISRYDMGIACLAIDSLPAALEWFDKVNRSDERPLALEASAETFMRAGQFQEAGDCYASAIVHQPFFDRRLMKKASFAYRSAENDVAAVRFERLASDV